MRKYIILLSAMIFLICGMVRGGGPYSDPFILTLSYLDFISYPSAPPFKQGRIFYDVDNGCLAMYPEHDGPLLQIGQEQWVHVENHTGNTIYNGAVVYIYHPDNGNKPYAALAKADVASTSSIIGVATHDIEQGSHGFITTLGLVNDIDTKDFDAGAKVYLSATTAGSFTSTLPDSPNASVMVGRVLRSNQNNGILFVSPRINGSLDRAAFMDGVNIPNMTEHDDNAAAIASGLGVGALYRTGDIVKVVH